MNAQTAFFYAQDDARPYIDARGALERFRELEARTLAAQQAVERACEAFKANRTPELQDSYATADRAYDAARRAFQLGTYQTVTAIRSIARFARDARLLCQPEGRML